MITKVKKEKRERKKEGRGFFYRKKKKDNIAHIIRMHCTVNAE